MRRQGWLELGRGLKKKERGRRGKSEGAPKEKRGGLLAASRCTSLAALLDQQPLRAVSGGLWPVQSLPCETLALYFGSAPAGWASDGRLVEFYGCASKIKVSLQAVRAGQGTGWGGYKSDCELPWPRISKREEYRHAPQAVAIGTRIVAVPP